MHPPHNVGVVMKCGKRANPPERTQSAPGKIVDRMIVMRCAGGMTAIKTNFLLAWQRKTGCHAARKAAGSVRHAAETKFNRAGRNSNEGCLLALQTGACAARRTHCSAEPEDQSDCRCLSLRDSQGAFAERRADALTSPRQTTRYSVLRLPLSGDYRRSRSGR
jgi:hypothetical protein